MAIKLENNGEAVYRSAIAKVKKPELVCLLEWMADEEVQHARFFSDLKLKLETKRENPFVAEMSRELFDDLLGNQNFSLKEVDFSSIDHSDALIAIFIEFEKDSLIFYKVLEPFVEDPVALSYQAAAEIYRTQRRLLIPAPVPVLLCKILPNVKSTSQFLSENVASRTYQGSRISILTCLNYLKLKI
ncbi:MAG: ferritin family protein [Desulfobacterales bacterium]